MAIELTLLHGVSYRGQEVSSPQMAALLAALTLEVPGGAGTRRLTEELWPESPPEHPAKALQVLVSRTRTRLGAEIVVSTSQGYRLGLDDDQIDALAAERQLVAARRSRRAGEIEQALLHADRGLALLEGTGPADEDDGPLGQLRRRGTAAGEGLVAERARALARLGRSEEALPLLQAAVARHPQDEELLLTLLRAEAATSGVAPALRRYETYRRRLRDTLGTDPGKELRALHAELLAGDQPLRRSGIVQDPNPLLGRDDDVTALTALLRRSRVVTVTGPGGLGKTRIANLLARTASTPTVHVVPLAGLGRGGDVAGEVAWALGVAESREAGRYRAPLRDLVDGIIEALGPNPAMLVLDNCEHVLAEAAELVAALIKARGMLTVLTTSRAPLGLSAEAVYPLPQLDIAAASELFRQRAVAARPDVALPEVEVAELCHNLEGLPLAIELAAARARVLSVEEINERLADRFALLRGGSRDAPDRHRTLQAVIDWSWQLLEPDAQRALAWLSVFADGFGLEAATTVLGADALDVVQHLVDQSLINITGDETGRGTRFRMLETVREYAAMRLAEMAETGQALAAYRAWAMRLATAHGPKILGPQPVPSIEIVRVERDNLYDALRIALAADDVAAVAVLAWATAAQSLVVASLMQSTPLLAESLVVLSRAPASDLSGEQLRVTRSAIALCGALHFVRAPKLLARAVLALRRLGEDAPVRDVEGAVAYLLQHTDLRRPEEGVHLVEEENPWIAVSAHLLVAHFQENIGRLDAAADSAAAALGLAWQCPSVWLEANCLARAGELALQRGDAETAERLGLQAIPLFELLGAVNDLAQVRWELASTRLFAGDIDGALAQLELARHAVPGEWERLGVHFDLVLRAEIDLARGRVDDGLAAYRRAVRETRHLDEAIRDVPTEYTPWRLATQSQCVAVHAHQGRLHQVSEMVRDLRQRGMHLTAPSSGLAWLDVPVCGLVLSGAAIAAVAAAESTPKDREIGARLMALSERYGFGRVSSSLRPDAIRRLVLAHSSDDLDLLQAYDEAAETYLPLERDALLAEGHRLLTLLTP